jgi:hypothetical protein
MELNMNKSKQQYHNHKARAKRKVVPFELSFDEWMKIWTDSGHYHEKGTKRGQYVMSRYKDQGGYTLYNVYIQTVGANTKEAFTTNNSDFIKPRRGEENHFYGKKHTESSIEKIKIARAKQVWSLETNRKRSEAMKKARALAGAKWS